MLQTQAASLMNMSQGKQSHREPQHKSVHVQEVNRGTGLPPPIRCLHPGEATVQGVFTAAYRGWLPDQGVTEGGGHTHHIPGTG